jgi:hypothetical protein
MTKYGAKNEMAGVVLEECVGIDCEQDPKKRKVFIEDVSVLMYMLEMKIKFEERNSEPVMDNSIKLHTIVPQMGKFQKHELYLRPNRYQMYDHWIKLDFWTSWEGTFFDVGHVSSATLPTQTEHPLLLGEVQIFLDNLQIDHERTIYNFLDLMGDLGGDMEVFTLAFGIFIFPVSEFSFLLKGISILYLARTKDKGLFEEVKARNNKGKPKVKNMKLGVPESLKGTAVAKEAGLH